MKANRWLWFALPAVLFALEARAQDTFESTPPPAESEPSELEQARAEREEAERQRKAAEAERKEAEAQRAAAEEAAQQAQQKQKRKKAQQEYFDARGTLEVGLQLGGSTVRRGDSSEFAFNLGLSVSYAPILGIVPGARGTAYMGGLTGGEVVGTLRLTPPIKFVIVPYINGEAGWRSWDGFGDGGLFGVGGGLHLGNPAGAFKSRIGYIYRYFNAEPGFDEHAIVFGVGFGFST